MYAFFKGKIDNIFKDRIIIDVNDIGYEIYMPESELLTLNAGENIKIYTYLHVREDDMRLFGFSSNESLEFFKKLITVSGVGPKVALGIISNVDTESLCVAIATENIAALKSVPGIGPKMAQKIIFELKDKVVKEQIDNIKVKTKETNSKNIEEATTALEVLGYTHKQIKEVTSRLELSEDSVETIIRKVLKEMQNM
ncbi:MAG: Holliday junction branch migration protein RuvA [Clostridia bacterium]|nr:Holliday junction branch migration protein RuvA [Clostridia bacterium]